MLFHLPEPSQAATGQRPDRSAGCFSQRRSCLGTAGPAFPSGLYGASAGDPADPFLNFKTGIVKIFSCFFFQVGVI